jgi:toxin ParE1/3/4
MAKFLLSNKAVENLSKIWDYTYEVWSENQADKYYELLIETCKEIAKTPNIGKPYEDIERSIIGFGCVNTLSSIKRLYKENF